MKKPIGTLWSQMPFDTVPGSIKVLLAELGRFAEVVLEALCNEDYRRRVSEFMASGAFTPSEQYQRAKRIMGFGFYGVEEAFRLGFVFRGFDFRTVQNIPYTEETLVRCASTHFLVLVPRNVYTRFNDSLDDTIRNSAEHVRESVQTPWHWILFRSSLGDTLFEGEELVPLFDTLYVWEVNGVTHTSPQRVGNSFKSNGRQIVLIPDVEGKYRTSHPGDTDRYLSAMVKPDKV